MASATTSPSTAKKARSKAAAKSTSAKAAPRRRGASAASTQSKASHAKGTRTRAAHQAEAALRQTQTATKETADVFGDYAERAILIPVGAALVARDRVVSSVNDTVSSYSSTSKAQAQLRKFERRGNTARKRLEREVRKARTSVEREVRKARTNVERELRARRQDGSELADRLQERIQSLV
jgi:hypothetical protein